MFASGAIYHVYCRVGRSGPVLADADDAAALVEQIAEVRLRDGFAILAWCVMPTHYHLAVRSGEVPLWRTMRTVQGRFAQMFNRRHRLIGSLWQERYKCKLVDSNEYLRQLLAYIHLNPVAARLAKTADGYRWSGHLELLGRRTELGLADVDEALSLLGGTVREARRTYRRMIAAASGREWLLETPGALPWWTREGYDERDVQPPERPRIDATGSSSSLERPSTDAKRFLGAVREVLGEDAWVLESLRRVRSEVAQRDLIVLLAVERYGVRVKDLAERFGKRPDAVSRWAMRGAARRREDQALADSFLRLDAVVAGILRRGNEPKGREVSA